MKLYQIQTINGHSFETELADCPRGLLYSRAVLTNFLRLYASRIFGNEGRDWRICCDDKALVPLTVNQIVSTGYYGDQLIIK